jgi:hypothetical protein
MDARTIAKIQVRSFLVNVDILELGNLLAVSFSN